MGNCCVVDSFACSSPANLVGGNVRTKCWFCAQSVCVGCSLFIEHGGAKRRFCHNCIRMEYGEYDPRPYEHIYVLAGHTAAGGRAAAEQERQAHEEREREQAARGRFFYRHPAPDRRR